MKRITVALLLAVGGCLCIASARGCTLPIPIVEPAPIKADGLHVLIVEETEQRAKLPSSQLAIFTAADVRSALAKAKYRILDADADLTHDEQVWREAMQIKRDGLPWIVVSNGKTGYSGPLPKTVQETVDLIAKYGG